MINRISSLALNGIALAMGIAVVISNILGTLNVQSAAAMLGLGLAALALASLQKQEPISFNK